VVRSRLASLGEIVQVRPLIQAEGKITFEFLVTTREVPAHIATWEADGIASEPMEQAGPSEVPASTPGQAATEDNPFISPAHVVRVDLKRLDELMRITGELGILRSRFEQHLEESNRAGAAPDVAVLNEVSAAFARSLREIREGLRRVRLVPVAEIFARMPFVVRDLSRETMKRARLDLAGQQTEIDKYIIERLKDPLLHLVRNAFAHGIETPEERSGAGKSPEATIVLAASTLGDSVIVEVRDDGRGIDTAAVVQRAMAGGVPVPEVLDDAALLEILGAPGLSTREDADRAAGRGVGMSVVLNTVRDLGGSVSLKSEKGKGTRFKIRLPVTLIVAETFILSAAGQTCAVPQSGVSEIIQISPNDLRLIHGSEMIPYRGGVLPIIHLASLFELRSAERPRWTVLVLISTRGSVGLLVEQVHGHKEVVVRAIRDPLLQVPFVAGATELGDGKPVLILDPSALASGVIRPHSDSSSVLDGNPSSPLSPAPARSITPAPGAIRALNSR
jgi:two-component system, chemotaxis family, sensor kinase CheA